jgi:hypothetical protein
MKDERMSFGEALLAIVIVAVVLFGISDFDNVIFGETILENNWNWLWLGALTLL